MREPKRDRNRLEHILNAIHCIEEYTNGISEVISQLCEEGVQSLIVEGGAQTHRSFLDAGLWDELRVETAPVEYADGTRAADIPADALLISREQYGENIIERFLSPNAIA